MLRNSIHVFFLGLSLVCSSGAQQQACTAPEIPVGITDVRGEPFRGVGPQDFSLHTSGGQIAIKSMSFDNGARRVALVVDRNKSLSSDTRRAEQEAVKVFLASARPEDSFALVVARGPEQVVKFGTGKEAIVAALTEQSAAAGRRIGTLDAVMEAINLFGDHQPGDTIVLIAADTGGNHSAHAKNVAQALEQHRIRMFGLALGPVSTKNIAEGGQTTTAWGLATVTPGLGQFSYNTGDEDFFPLATDSGGTVFSLINGDMNHSYSMNNPKLQQHVEQVARIAFNMIASLYRVQLERSRGSHVQGWSMDPAEELRQNGRRTVILLYPHRLGPC